MPSAFYNTDCIKAASQHENNTTQISNIVEHYMSPSKPKAKPILSYPEVYVLW